ncbi:SMI1/KNR4 family protein [Escherichia marmotae]|uniref:SMI1/KNR4 family protein n=1 Tax=Escherichia marmotae TaxID=1499973 RepID=A0AAW5MI29_9ESCH|nr:SMI1/KNR4 family protein [Escherichia marmotae]
MNNFYSINNSKYETILSAINRWGKVLGKGVLPIARDGGDNQFYLNLNETEPSVWIYLHDGNDKREKLADSLAEFIDKLQINPDYL